MSRDLPGNSYILPPLVSDAERPMWLPECCVCPVDVPADTKDDEDDPDSTNIGTGAMDVDDMIEYLSDPQNSTKELLQLINTFSNVAGYKIGGLLMYLNILCTIIKLIRGSEKKASHYIEHRSQAMDGEIPVWVPERCVRTVDASRSRPDGDPHGKSPIVAI
ncbi:hypothetical protein STEG23_019577 [Scotinomys teguina]